MLHLGSGAVSWASKKQPIIALSTTETEYVAATGAACQTIWMRRMLRDLCDEQDKGTKIYCDNSSVIADVDQKCSFILQARSLDDLQVENTGAASGCSPHQLAVCQAHHPDTCVSGEVINSQMHLPCVSTGRHNSNTKNISYRSRT